MSMNATENLNFIRISSPKDWYFDPTRTADLLKGLHSAQEKCVLETIATPRGLRFFVRTESGQSGARSHLKSALGSVMAPGRTDPLLLSRGQDASVRTLHLREHAALPSARYSEDDTMRLWNTVAQGVKGGSGEAFGGTGAVRVVLQPAPADWYGPYVDHFRSDRTPGAGGIASRLGLSGPPDRSAHVDRDLAALKSQGLAFYSEIQVATIYDDNTDARRAANAALDRLTEQVINLTGHSTIWRQGATKTVSGRKLHQGRSGHEGLEPWELMAFLEPKRATYGLSPRETAPLWRARLAIPTAISAEAVRTPQPVQAVTAPMPVAQASAAPTDAVGERPVGSNCVADEKVGLIDEQRVVPDAHTALQPFGYVGEGALLHSDQPPTSTIAREPNRAERRSERRKRGKDSRRCREAIAAARPSAVRALALAERDLLVFDQLGDMPLGSAQDIARAFGWSPTTVYAAMRALEGTELIGSVQPHIGGSAEQRSWVPDDQWELIMGDRHLPHPAQAIQRLWLNPEMLSAVYQVVGFLVQDVPGRELVALRWLRTHAFDAVAQCNDGWAAFLWAGVWTDQAHLEERLRACTEELSHWSERRGTHRPGRLIFVVPHRWQGELVWRAARRQGWADCCAVYDSAERTLIGDLDLRASRGRIPPAIGDGLKPLRLDVSKVVTFLAADQANRWTRLLFCIEQYPGIIAGHLAQLTGINGAEVSAGLKMLISLGKVSELPRGGYRIESRPLAAAARRDRAWAGLPGRRFGLKTLTRYSGGHWQHLSDTTRVLSKFAAAGCTVAPGWQATDVAFRPDGVVWLHSTHGHGWHYLVYASHARQESTVASVLKRAFSETRTDHYPILLICRPEIESTFWRLGAGRPMLTASVSRLRTGPVAGADSTAWWQYGKPTLVLAGPGRDV